MSRSRRKTPKFGITGDDRSDKKDKRIANRKFRSLVNQKLRQLAGSEDEDMLLPELREVTDVYNFSKDGKSYRTDFEEKDLRK